jgi:putative acetyltransferase
MVTETNSAPRERLPVRNPPMLPGAIIGASAGLVLRHARDDDAEAIIALVSQVWSEYPGKTLVAAADMPELLRPASAYERGGGQFWVVEAAQFPEDRIVGTIALTPSAEAGVVELQKLYVARDMRRNGLGSFLCSLVEREARERGAHAIELWSDVKLLDAHRRYERLGYQRGDALKTYNDTSATVRYYYRKELAAPGREPVVRHHWQTRFQPSIVTNRIEQRVNIMKRLSFTEHPASVGENYLEHLRHATGFAVSMISGGLACLVHAILPFLFTHTGSSVIVALNTRMVTNRRRSVPQTSTPDRNRVSAA